MAGKQAVMDHEWASKRIPICSYASFFLGTSITIMATDRRIFPSQLMGKILPGREIIRKISSPTTHYGKTGDGSPIGLFGGDIASAPHVLMADLLFSAKAGLQPSERTCFIHNAVHLTSREMTI